MKFAAAVLLAAPALSACAFLVDFDELQKGNHTPTKDAGTGGQTGATGGSPASEAGASGGAGGAGGTGGAPIADGSSDASCTTSCDDNDPCTVDACSAGACTHARMPGIVPDGLSAKALANTFHRVTIAAHKDTFYLSAFKSTATGKDVLLHSFGLRETILPLGRSLTNLVSFNGNVPVSAAGIAAGDSDTVIKLFVAAGQTVGQPAQVWEITADTTAFSIQSAVPAAADANYAGSATTYPIAWAPSGSEVYAAWPGAPGGVFMHRAGNAEEATGTPPVFGGSGKVTSVAPLGAGSVPGVLYIGALPYVQAVGQATPIPLGGCDAHQGTYGSAVSAFAHITGVWVGGWTKVLSSGSTVTELKPVLCGSGSGGVGCVGSLRCENGDQSLPGVKNPAMLFATLAGDPANRVYQIVAAPYVDTVKNQAGLGLEMTQVDLSLSTDGGTKTTPITTTPIALATTTPGPNAPDWPAMALLAPDRLAIAWIEPGGGALGQDALHIERHRICFPKK